MSKYRLTKARLDEKWDRFIEESPNGTAFAKCNYLKSLDVGLN